MQHKLLYCKSKCSTRKSMQNESNNIHIPYVNQPRKGNHTSMRCVQCDWQGKARFYVLRAGLDYGEEVHQLVKNFWFSMFSSYGPPSPYLMHLCCHHSVHLLLKFNVRVFLLCFRVFCGSLILNACISALWWRDDLVFVFLGCFSYIACF